MSNHREKTVELSPTKRRQILDGARQVFIELGFERASVGLMAERAGVSKATIYNHFADKAALFVACLDEECMEARSALNMHVSQASVLESVPQAGSGDLERDLCLIGERLVRLLISPTKMALHRVIVAEAPRFPEVGRHLYEMFARHLGESLGTYFKLWSDRGALHVEDPVLAANQFLDLCKGDAFRRVELAVVKEIPDEEVRAAVSAAVRTFLRAYRS
jgi:TetR/AcrR family transcriptional regulator, mexJK operon transcriptional repressor